MKLNGIKKLKKLLKGNLFLNNNFEYIGYGKARNSINGNMLVIEELSDKDNSCGINTLLRLRLIGENNGTRERLKELSDEVSEIVVSFEGNSEFNKIFKKSESGILENVDLRLEKVLDLQII